MLAVSVRMRAMLRRAASVQQHVDLPPHAIADARTDVDAGADSPDSTCSDARRGSRVGRKAAMVW